MVQQLLLYTNILSRGYPTKLKNYGNSRGWGEGVWQATPGMEIPGVGGLKQKCPPWEVWIYFGTTPVRTYDKRRLTL